MQLIGVPDQAEKDKVINAVMDLKISEVEEGYTVNAIKSRQVDCRTRKYSCKFPLTFKFIFLS